MDKKPNEIHENFIPMKIAAILHTSNPYITNNPKAFIYSPSQLFFETPQYAYVHVYHTHIYSWSTPSYYSSTAAFNDFYNELTPYTPLANLLG